MNIEKLVYELCRSARKNGRNVLLEPEVYKLLRAGGLNTPEFYTINLSEKLDRQIKTLGVEKAVVKVVSPKITHKTEIGGVKIVPDRKFAILAAVKSVLHSVKKKGGKDLLDSVKEILVSEFVPCDHTLGSEFFAGLRWSRDMGHILTAGFGGLDTEEMSEKFAPGQSTIVFSPQIFSEKEALAKLSSSFAYRRLTGKTREKKQFVDDKEIIKVLKFFYAVVNNFSNNPKYNFIIEDFEINPFFASGGKLTAVDAFFRFSTGNIAERTVDLEKIRRLLRPQSVAVIGVSQKSVNPGRVILRNLLREKFPAENIRVVREDCDEIDNVACVKCIKDLPWSADLLAVAVSANQAPDIVSEVIAEKKAQSILLVSGGMGETDAGKGADRRTREILFGARQKGEWTPVLVGPNCLGIRSMPGKYDTLFIPEFKFPSQTGNYGNIALICQSGAFMITRMNELPFINPEYAISTGNQMDLTLADFVQEILGEEDIKVIALYIEGFKPLDGLRLARLIKKGSALGKDFIIYKAGRTAEGITAASSHTASIARDYKSCVEVLSDAGALVAASFDDFKGCLSMSALLHKKKFAGDRIGAISNAGFETVGMADNVLSARNFKLAKLSQGTLDRIRNILAEAGLELLINIRNPLDLTPMSVDRIFVECLKAYIEDENVDAIIMGFVPMTPALKTLPAEIEDPMCLAALLPPIINAADKPVVTVVDAGMLYDPLAELLQSRGIPCFRSSDFALQLLQKFVSYKIERRNSEVGR